MGPGERIGRCLGALAASLAAVGTAGAEPCRVGPTETVWALEVTREGEIDLVDGRRVVLATVEVPHLPPSGGDGAARAAARRVAAAARAGIADRVEGRGLSLVDLGEDRHGRRRGHLLDIETGHWLQEDLVEAGLVRVAPTPDDRACARALLAREASVRAARRGFWGEAPFAVRRADRDLVDLVGGVAVVEGTVRSVGRSGGRIWLNFGDDIRRDFAVVMNDKDRDRFAGAGIAVDRLGGRRVSVRGIVTERDGPRIEIGDPEEIDPLER